MALNIKTQRLCAISIEPIKLRKYFGLSIMCLFGITQKLDIFS